MLRLLPLLLLFLPLATPFTLPVTTSWRRAVRAATGDASGAGSPSQEEKQAKHQAYLNEVQANRDRAKARREKNSKKFWQKKAVYDQYRERSKEKKREERAGQTWERVVTLDWPDLVPGEWYEGKVRNVMDYGAWVDIGAKADGLLHVRDMSQGFTSAASDMVSTGDVVKCTVKYADPVQEKLALSLVPIAEQEPEPADGIPLEDIEEGDEFWGYVTKVTNFGAFVMVGVEVHGFLHIMEYPKAEGRKPEEVFEKGMRLRVYASEVDLVQRRVKLTCYRPDFLPKVGGGQLVTPQQEEQ